MFVYACMPACLHAYMTVPHCIMCVIGVALACCTIGLSFCQGSKACKSQKKNCRERYPSISAWPSVKSQVQSPRSCRRLFMPIYEGSYAQVLCIEKLGTRLFHSEYYLADASPQNQAHQSGGGPTLAASYGARLGR